MNPKTPHPNAETSDALDSALAKWNNSRQPAKTPHPTSSMAWRLPFVRPTAVQYAAGFIHPPNALEVFLETFEGVDILLTLIHKQNFNVLDIPMAQVTEQYLIYVDQIKTYNLELASNICSWPPC